MNNQEEKESRAKRFAEIYLYEHPGNYTRAYEQFQKEFRISVNSWLKDSSIRCMASRYANTDEVRRAIAAERERAAKLYAIDKEEIVANLMQIAYDEDAGNKDRLAAIKQLTDIAGYAAQNINLNAKADIEVVIE